MKKFLAAIGLALSLICCSTVKATTDFVIVTNPADVRMRVFSTASGWHDLWTIPIDNTQTSTISQAISIEPWASQTTSARMLRILNFPERKEVAAISYNGDFFGGSVILQNVAQTNLKTPVIGSSGAVTNVTNPLTVGTYYYGVAAKLIEPISFNETFTTPSQFATVVIATNQSTSLSVVADLNSDGYRIYRGTSLSCSGTTCNPIYTQQRDVSVGSYSFVDDSTITWSAITGGHPLSATSAIFSTLGRDLSITAGTLNVSGPPNTWSTFNFLANITNYSFSTDKGNGLKITHGPGIGLWVETPQAQVNNFDVTTGFVINKANANTTCTSSGGTCNNSSFMSLKNGARSVLWTVTDLSALTVQVNAGAATGTIAPGIVKCTNGSATVNGFSTFFTSWLGKDDQIDCGGSYVTVSSITNDTTLTLTSSFVGTTGDSPFKIKLLTVNDKFNLLWNGQLSMNGTRAGISFKPNPLPSTVANLFSYSPVVGLPLQALDPLIQSDGTAFFGRQASSASNYPTTTWGHLTVDSTDSATRAAIAAFDENGTSGADHGGVIAMGGAVSAARAYTIFADISGQKFNSTSTNTQGYFRIRARNGSDALVEVFRMDTVGSILFGGQPSAAPQAQTFSVQNATGSNIAAVTTTVIGSLGTGTGANGSILFQTGTPQTTGSAAHVATTVMTLKDAGSAGTAAPQVLLPDGTAALPVLANATRTTDGIYFSSTGASRINMTVAGSQVFAISTGNATWLANMNLGGSATSPNGILVSTGSGTWTFGGGQNVSPIAQIFSMQGSRGTVDTNTAGADFTFKGSLGTGTATGSKITIQAGTPQATGTAQHVATTALTIQDFGLANVQRALITNASGSTLMPDGNTFRVTADFTLAANTSLQTITGLAFILPANRATNTSFKCEILYSQATAAVPAQFGIQTASYAATNVMAKADVDISASTFTAGNVPTLAATTATAIVTFTPSAIATVFNARIAGFIENPSNAAEQTVNIMAQTSNASDLVTVKRGSYCTVGF